MRNNTERLSPRVSYICLAARSEHGVRASGTVTTARRLLSSTTCIRRIGTPAEKKKMTLTARPLRSALTRPRQQLTKTKQKHAPKKESYACENSRDSRNCLELRKTRRVSCYFLLFLVLLKSLRVDFSLQYARTERRECGTLEPPPPPRSLIVLEGGAAEDNRSGGRFRSSAAAALPTMGPGRVARRTRN